jgi:hypothetical protein
LRESFLDTFTILGDHFIFSCPHGFFVDFYTAGGLLDIKVAGCLAPGVLDREASRNLGGRRTCSFFVASCRYRGGPRALEETRQRLQNFLTVQLDLAFTNS